MLLSILSLIATNLFTSAIGSPFRASVFDWSDIEVYVFSPAPGNNPPSTTPDNGDVGSNPKKFKWVPRPFPKACPSVDKGV